MKDVSFEMDSFSRNKVYVNSEAFAQQLYILLVNKPGYFPDDPLRCIGIDDYRMRFAEEISLELRQKVLEQGQEYCDFQISEVSIVFKNGQLFLGVDSPSFSDIFVIKSDPESTSLVTLKNS
jgi:hypothetical protein